LEKNILSILAMEDKAIEFSYMRDEMVVGQKGVDPNKRRLIGRREKNLYMLRGQPV